MRKKSIKRSLRKNRHMVFRRLVYLSEEKFRINVAKLFETEM
jgi:hypothetical protein